MEFKGTLLVVEDIEKAKVFYRDVLDQKVTLDLKDYVALESGLALQANYAQVVGQPMNTVYGANNFQIYFEVQDIVKYVNRIKEDGSIHFVHDVRAYPWGQQAFRICDTDKNVIEIAEDMNVVIKRYLDKGLSVEEVSEKTMYPVDYIKTII